MFTLGQLGSPICGMLACGNFAPTRRIWGTGMGVLLSMKRQRDETTAGPGMMLLGSGWCLHSSRRPEDCAEIFRQAFYSYRPYLRRMRSMHSLFYAVLTAMHNRWDVTRPYGHRASFLTEDTLRHHRTCGGYIGRSDPKLDSPGHAKRER
jgi:hypothetical protein